MNPIIVGTFNPGYLLGVAVLAIALLLVLIIKFKIHAFVSLTLVSLVTAIASGISPDHQGLWNGQTRKTL